MNSLFDLDNPFWRFIQKIIDACFLSILYLIFCIPIFTIGAANSALYYTLLKRTRDEEGYLVKDFFKSFLQNFKQATVIWLILLTVGIVLVIDIYYFKTVQTLKGAFIYYLLLVMFVFYYVINLYIFPLIAKFENTTRNILKFSFAMPIRHIGWTIIMLILDTVIILSALKISIFLIFVPGVLTLFNSYVFNHIFDRYINETNQNNDYVDNN